MDVRFGFFLAIVLCTPSMVHAGSWTKSFTYSGSTVITNDGGTPMTRRWRPDGEDTDYYQAVLAGHSGTCTSSGTITVKLTWVGSPDNTSDPAPTSLWLYLKPVASAQGDTKTADDGMGDPPTSSGNYTFSQYSGNGHLQKFNINNGSVSVSDSLTATGSASTPAGTPGGQGHTYGAGCAFDVNIHAQPYAMALTNHIFDYQTPGDIYFEYHWKSTSVSLADINSNVTVTKR